MLVFLKRNSAILLALIVIGIMIWFFVPRHPIRGLASMTEGMPSECRKEAENVLATDLSKYRSHMSQQLLSFKITDPDGFLHALGVKRKKHCQWETISMAVNDAFDKYVQSCEEAENSVRQSGGDLFNPVYRCFRHWAGYRHEITFYVSRNMRISEIEDISLLENLIFPVLIEGTENNLNEVAEIAERIAKLSKDQAHRRTLALRLVLQVRYLQWSRMRLDGNKRLLEQSWQALTENNPTDPLLAEIELGKYRHASDITTLKRSAKQLMALHENLTTGPYHLAWAEYLSGNKKRAKWYLRFLLTYHPSDIRALHSLTALRNPRYLAYEQSPFIDLAQSLASVDFELVEKNIKRP